jgi:hypothetical protein
MSMNLDRLMLAVRRLLEALLPDFDLYAMHPGTVIKVQESVGAVTVDVRPDNSRLPELIDIPIRTFTPNAKITVGKDARVLIAFEGGQRDQPVCVAWGAGNLEELTIPANTINLGGENGKAVARVDDTTTCTLYLAPSVVGKISATPSAEPQPFGPPLPFTPFTFETTINSGSSKVNSE